MLSRTGKINYSSQDVIRQLFICIFKEGKRKFNTSTNERFCYYDINEDNFNKKRYGGFEQKNYRFEGRYNNTYGNRRPLKHGKLFEDYNDSRINWDSVELKPLKNNFYKPHENVLNRSAEEIRQFHLKNNINIFGQDCPAPILNFNELNLPEEVMEYIRSLNYSEPTPIQSQTWPIALSGRDMVGISRTGSGKTLGYILPAIIHIKNQDPLEENEGPIALVLAPTRELVQQIQSVTYPIAQASHMRPVSLFGGASKANQFREIMGKRQIYVATPGRLLDFLQDGSTNLKRCSYLVLDEADQMLNMGFEPQIRSIINRIRPDRQVLMWSATWPKEILNLANEFLKKYIKVQVGSAELNANPNIIQTIHVCQEEDKLQLLFKILNETQRETENKTLIFALTKFSVEKVRRFLRSKGIPSQTLHGDHTQNMRDRIMSDFRSGFVKVLVATNVAGRGLDVNDIKYVINFDFPQTIEEYIHKIGRTARSNNSGTSYTFFTPDNARLAQDLISVLENSDQIISPELKELAYGGHRFSSQNSNYDYKKFRY